MRAGANALPGRGSVLSVVVLASDGRAASQLFPARVFKDREYMKDKIQKQHSIYTFQRSQISTGDVREFLTKYDPARLPHHQVAELFGGISFQFEGIDAGEIHTQSEPRILLRRLHAIWPWAAYFLNLDQPLGPAVGLNKTPLLAMAMCVADRPFDEKQILHIVKPQLRRFQFRSHEAVDRLGKRAGIPARYVAARHRAIDKQFQPYLQKI